MNPPVVAANSFEPSADDVTQDQFVIGALVWVQFSARQRLPPASTPVKHITHTILKQTAFMRWAEITIVSHILEAKPGSTFGLPLEQS